MNVSNTDPSCSPPGRFTSPAGEKVLCVCKRRHLGVNVGYERLSAEQHASDTKPVIHLHCGSHHCRHCFLFFFFPQSGTARA